MAASSTSVQRRPRVCILGGGFGGLCTALRLDSLSWPEGRKPDVTLVDQHDRFVFKPLMYELLGNRAPDSEVAPPYSTLLAPTSVRFLQQTIKAVKPADSEGGGVGGSVTLGDGSSLDYDWLVVALGGVVNLGALLRIGISNRMMHHMTRARYLRLIFDSNHVTTGIPLQRVVVRMQTWRQEPGTTRWRSRASRTCSASTARCGRSKTRR
jgi:Pyridine nucleotide-disulphide oxidoreductase